MYCVTDHLQWMKNQCDLWISFRFRLSGFQTLQFLKWRTVRITGWLVKHLFFLNLEHLKKGVCPDPAPLCHCVLNVTQSRRKKTNTDEPDAAWRSSSLWKEEYFSLFWERMCPWSQISSLFHAKLDLWFNFRHKEIMVSSLKAENLPPWTDVLLGKSEMTPNKGQMFLIQQLLPNNTSLFVMKHQESKSKVNVNR